MKSNTGFSVNFPWGDRLNVELLHGEERITVAKVWELYEPVTRRHNRSWNTDVSRAKHIVRHLGERKVGGLSATDIEEYRRIRGGELTQRGSPPSPQQLNAELKILRRSINYAIDCGHVSANPIAKVKLLKTRNVRHSVITETQLLALIEAADGDLRPILLVAYDTGMRKSEILKLKWSQIDLEEGAIILSETKNDRPRTIYLTSRLHRELSGMSQANAYVFVNPRTNRPWCDIRRKWTRACAIAGVEGAWFHDTRRSFVTHARRAGVQESVVREITGHRTREVFDRYNIVSPADIRNAAKIYEMRNNPKHDQP